MNQLLKLDREIKDVTARLEYVLSDGPPAPNYVFKLRELLDKLLTERRHYGEELPDQDVFMPHVHHMLDKSRKEELLRKRELMSHGYTSEELEEMEAWSAVHGPPEAILLRGEDRLFKFPNSEIRWSPYLRGELRDSERSDITLRMAGGPAKIFTSRALDYKDGRAVYGIDRGSETWWSEIAGMTRGRRGLYDAIQHDAHEILEATGHGVSKILLAPEHAGQLAIDLRTLENQRYTSGEEVYLDSSGGITGKIEAKDTRTPFQKALDDIK